MAERAETRHEQPLPHKPPAVAASILTAAYHMLKDGTVHADPGPDHFRKTQPMTCAKALARQIEGLGFKCAISQAEPVSI